MKLVFDEPGTTLAGELWDSPDSVVSSQLVYPEARAAAAAAHRGGRFGARALRRAVATPDGLYSDRPSLASHQPRDAGGRHAGPAAPTPPAPAAS